MRTDMYKVIVERPRLGRHLVSERRVDDPDESPRSEGLRKRHRIRKGLNENLRPLRRFLDTQVGRPWDKVYGEICERIDRRNTVQQHIHQHLDDFVAIRVVELDGVLHAIRPWREPRPLDSRYSPDLYVCPRSGLLQINRQRLRTRRLERIEHERAQLRSDRRVLDSQRQLHRVDGVWFAIDVARLAEAPALQSRPMDVLRKREPSLCPPWKDVEGVMSNFNLFGEYDVYAWRKRQLGTAELRRHGLVNVNEPRENLPGEVSGPTRTRS